MNLKITVRHKKINDTIKQYLRSKLDVLVKYFDQIKHIEVILDHNKNLYSAEIIISIIFSGKLISKTSHYDCVAAIDIIIKKIERQLSKLKGKIKKGIKKSSVFDTEEGIPYQKKHLKSEQENWY
ncbi:MAG: ribosome-associated translation inhibitor RaiA [Planctomycetota bacterium]